MRFYNIVVGGKQYNSLGDPGALNVEVDIPVVPFATPMGFAMVRIWGVSLADIGQANNLKGQTAQVFGGMAAGLPLANPAQAGLLVQGYVFQAFGNWIGVEQTLDIIIAPGSDPVGTGSPTAPANIVLEWKKGQPLSGAIQKALQTAFPGLQVSVNVGSNLVPPSDQIGYYRSLAELAQFVKQASKNINKDPNYAGVDITLAGTQFSVYDGSQQQASGKQIAFQDLIGQPTWIEAPLIQWKTAMRADIKVGDPVTLPPSQITNTQQAQSSLVNQSLNFQGGFTVSLVRHVGNFRQPDAASWVTIFEGYPSQASAA